ncbi:uncharacterized protein LOC125684361 [Lagopus muta]|uniref:uncharacterized protein LOC125684361 n=1 Tax=Lagopus muta TaxID=64668 RepID=UPI0020A1D8C1|nr:uncharacterized protein LOC125684361 [Lagopus muta]
MVSAGGATQQDINKPGDFFSVELPSLNDREALRRGAVLHPILTEKDGVMLNVNVKGSIGISVHEMEGEFTFEVSLVENYSVRKETVGLGQCWSGIKAGPNPLSVIRSSCLHLPGNQVPLQTQDMSCYDQCVPRLPCQPCGPTPLGSSCNEPCVRQCQDSNVFIQPSPVVVTLPGPILSSFPQNTAVGSSTSAAVGSILSSEGVPISSGGFGLSGIGSRFSGRRFFPC